MEITLRRESPCESTANFSRVTRNRRRGQLEGQNATRVLSAGGGVGGVLAGGGGGVCGQAGDLQIRSVDLWALVRV